MPDLDLIKLPQAFQNLILPAKMVREIQMKMKRPQCWNDLLPKKKRCSTRPQWSPSARPTKSIVNKCRGFRKVHKAKVKFSKTHTTQVMKLENWSVDLALSRNPTQIVPPAGWMSYPKLKGTRSLIHGSIPRTAPDFLQDAYQR